MADTTRRTSPALKESLLEHPSSFSFYQAIILIRRFFLEETTPPEGLRFIYDALRVRPHLSLAFPGSDITELREDTSGPYPVYHLTATFLGLYGCASPLPTFYTEDLIGEAAEDVSVTRDFLDVINSPLYPHLLEVMVKYRIFFQLAGSGTGAAIFERLYSLLGYGHPELRDRIAAPKRLLRYIGLFSQWPRSAMGLRTLVSDLLSGAPVSVDPNIPRMVDILDDQRLVLGSQCATLGVDAHLGSRIKDLMGKFRLVIGPLDEATFHACLPGRDAFPWLTELITLFLSEPMDCRLEVELKRDQARPARLGGNAWSALGLDTWIFSGAPPHQCRAVFELNPRERRHDPCRPEVPAA